MSAILKGLLQPQIQTVLSSFGGATYVGPPEGVSAQTLFADRLSTAIAVAVQQYLITNVKVTPGIPVATAGGPTNQVGATTAPGILQAP
jgi:hypothetical protein